MKNRSLTATSYGYGVTSATKAKVLSIDAAHLDWGSSWSAKDIIADTKTTSPEKEAELKEECEEMQKVEELDKRLSMKLAERVTDRFISLGSDAQTIIIDCCINNTSDSKMGEKLGKYRKTVTAYKRKGLKALKDEIESFFTNETTMKIQDQRRQRIIAGSLNKFLVLE